MVDQNAVPDSGGTSAGQEARQRLLTGLAVADRTLPVAGVPTAVLEAGAGPPVVLLHSSGEFAALWSRVIPDLAMTHRVVAPDLPGHGASGSASGRWDAGHVLAWLGELIEQTCPAPPAVVGHGLGGAIAARFAADHGARLGRLVLVDAFGLAAYDPTLSFGHALHGFMAQPTEATRDALFDQCFVDLDRLRGQMGARWEPLAAYALDRARTPDQQAALGILMADFGMPALAAADLARIAVPTTLIWGRRDLQVPLSAAETANARFGWPLHVIEDAGDDPAMEQPEAFLAALRMDLGTAAVTRGGDTVR
jgi:pimeloyl-ACP methyl ester carboxylesterase